MRKLELSRLPTFYSGVHKVWLRNFLQFRKAWLVNLFWILLEPLFFLLALGYGVGSYISSVQGVSYIDFFFPSLLCITSMMVSFFVSTYDTFSKLTHQKTYATMIMTPLDVEQVILGEIFWGASKGFFSSLGVVLVASIFGHVQTFLIIPALVLIFISSFVFSALGMIVTSYVKNFEAIIYSTSGFIIPMSLFCGTYFPLEQMPYGIKYVMYLFPLTHVVAAVRFLLQGGNHYLLILTHSAALLAFGYFFTKVALERMRKKLIK